MYLRANGLLAATPTAWPRAPLARTVVAAAAALNVYLLMRMIV